MRFIASLSLIGLLASQTGCAALVRYDTPSLSQMPDGPTSTQRSLGFFWGIVPPAKVSLDQCGTAGIKEMKVKQGFIDSLITYFTFGIVTSTKVKVTCARPASAEVIVPDPLLSEG